MQHSTPLNFALLLNRLTLGYLFVSAGIHKIFGEGGVSGFVHGFYARTTPHWLPHWFATPYGYTLPFAELTFGALLIIGFPGRWPAGVLMLMLASILMATCSAAAFKSGMILPVFVCLSLAILLLVTGPGKFSVDRFARGSRGKGAASRRN